MARFTIAIDAMGGDHGTRTVVPAALQVLEKHPDLTLILVGDSYILQKQLAKRSTTTSDRLQIHHASEKVMMDESPLHALRMKKNSSMRVAINLVKEGKAQACVSAGNTGALLAIARFVLKTLPGIDRPAIMRMLPTANAEKNVRVLDLGANVDSDPENLLQFALMGAAVTQAVDNIPNPSIGLLNIGVEEIKGNELVKKTALLLKECQNINYMGYIEADKIYDGKADVIVCDGFVGNIALKTIEGTMKLGVSLLREAFMRNLLTRMAGLMAKWGLQHLRKKMDPSRYNGASLVGLQGIVIKSHGAADANAFATAIEEAMKEVVTDVPTRIKDKLAELLKE